ncbi:hypothetical protein JG687_00006223 [Phytophthora cactorum]|uniref:Uncharacterized protein n=1 Tax=Phytophthora cactorum TaxID=29920 RepID=A0A8T1UKV5_9STRA|nr:hypothetical protein JG687_00006223 [Phytophthora cactorum]
MVVMCLAWTLWLLNISPISMVNHIMDTTSLERGSYWQFVDLPLPIYELAIFGLASIGVGYAFILVNLVRKRAYSARVSPENGALARIHAFSTGVLDVITRVATDRTASRSPSSAASLVTSLTSNEIIARKRLVCKPEYLPLCGPLGPK